MAPSLAGWMGLANNDYQDVIDISIAVIAGFLVQLVGWLLFVPIWSVVDFMLLQTSPNTRSAMTSLTIPLLASFPVAGVSYALYRYFSWVGAGQRSITVAFVGSLLVKVFLLPLIKTFVVGGALKLFIDWLRGDTAKPRGA